MAIPIVGAVAGLLSLVVDGVREHLRGRREIRRAVVKNKVRLAQSSQEFNQAWEMKQLENAGWKDDVLFYAWLAFFIWSGFDPQGADQVLQAWSNLPEWFLQVTFWIVAAVLGVKKIGDYLPATVRGVRRALARESRSDSGGPA
ncbi:hypothetical protein SAMN02745704_01881 [Paucidesulfovibrio gracilis DSM 16080]|uniref:Holin of 3TMs, for gene-transfer release n=1 Tax=Paucidesulfovibrio gracilis DSM 16080 TaxID=1121449 RepID=A0A1T4X8X3_9BACT|nr:hypothetical protein [Paucidesulfovibrio gracilis]SKA85535.1 hypothetical protein SAMN02745704_01881 [Paucidesulfovibrio gracilis DSM 16080]